MTKADIAGKVQAKLNLTAKQSTEIVETVFEMMKEALSSGQDLKIAGFGNFAVSDKAPRKGRNPQTGKEIVIAARRALSFKPGLALKRSVNGEL